ncbi:MAG: hypothetical protein CVV33_09600, partial [Methanomicrobiales archaeon HGW-Methanomicrobiales-4]
MTVNRASIDSKTADLSTWTVVGNWYYQESDYTYYGLADGSSVSKSINFTNTISPLTAVLKYQQNPINATVTAKTYIDDVLVDTSSVAYNAGNKTISIDTSTLTGYHTVKFVLSGGSNIRFGMVNLQGYVPPVTNFKTAIPSPLVDPFVVKFTDSSTQIPISWLWDFGDGQTSIEQNPTHTYSEYKTYTITLTTTNAYGSSNKSATVRIPAPPIVDFSAIPREGLTIDFKDLSANVPTGWLWDFG